MTTYAIGDIQGCYKTLKALLKKINFNPQYDKVILVGDLVNRGPDSLGVLRWAKDLKSRALTLLGNHDLRLLSMHVGLVNGYKRKEMQNILTAPDAKDLINWLRTRYLIHVKGRYVFVHAGILPNWDLAQAVTNAQMVQKTLRSEKYIELLKTWQTVKADKWSKNLSKYEKEAAILNVFTRMRMCKTPKQMDFSFTDKPEKAPKNLKAWFDYNSQKTQNYTIIFGHWSALGLRKGSNFVSLDSGCVWGGSLTAIRLDDRQISSQKNLE